MKFKKVLAFLLAAVLLLSVFTVSVGAESVEIFEVGVTAEPTIPVSTTPVIYKPGDNVTVTISADQNTGFDFLWLKVSFDADALEYVDYTTNTIFGKETFSVKSGYLTFTAILNRASTATGDMFKINFKIKDDFCGDAEIVASLVRDDEANCKNGDANVPFVGDKASVTAHAYDNACDPDHVYDNACDAECNVCKQIRTVPDHVYDNACDITCNVCEQIRLVDDHVYDNACDIDCNICSQIRNVSDHVYDDACDADCNVCSAVRDITHNFEWIVDKSENCGTDGSKHEECTVCHVKRNENTVIPATGNHIYDNECDTDCNICGATRTVKHVYNNDCDIECNVCGNIRLTDEHKYDWVIDKQADCGNEGIKHSECLICGVKQFENTTIPATGNHVYDNACDAECNVCNQTRTVPDHVYDNACDITCNVCEQIRLVDDHVYDNACDIDCNICGQIRTVSDHIYDNTCDTDCNICGDIRDITHNYEWIVDKSENCGTDGSKHEECIICHVKRNENTVIPATGNHVYDNACDTNCNVCDDIREITHNYEWVIDKSENCGVDGIKHEECTVCHTKRNENTVISATGNHTYDNVCDAECNVCKQTRTVPDHVYDNACDTDCNICDATRTITHDYEWVIDKIENCGVNGVKHEECTVCHTKRNENTVISATGNHTYDNDCDKVCNVCEQIRSVPNHIYDNACDAECNICKQIRAVPEHVYDNACDIDCNICGTTRTITHNFEWIVDKTENCGVNGTKHEECIVCHTKRNENTVITATGYHVFDNGCDTSCNICGLTRTVPHSYTTTTTKATTSKNGSIVKKCTKCGYVASKTTLKYAKTFKLSTTSYTYSGSAKKPTVKVYNSDGKLITSANYTVTYKNNKYVGKATVTVTFKKYYTGTKTLTFTINPKTTTVSKLTAAKKSIKVSIKKQSTQVTGYQVQYSTSKSFTSATTKTISSYKTTSYTIKSLKAKKTYYVRVRTYKTVNGKKYYSGWSTYKYVKTK